MLTRRRVLGRLGQLIALAPFADLTEVLHTAAGGAAASDKTRLIVRSVRPEDFETPLGLLTSWITPNDLFFVRSHLHTPKLVEREWVLTIDGEVERPLVLALQDVRKLDRVSRVVTLECAGNGRASFDPPVGGVQWQKGAVGNARWTGVRLADVLKAAGVKAGGRFVLFDGADRSIGKVPDFVRTVPMDKAMHPDTLLAYEMNGVPLPVSNGFPLRAVVPGWEGAYSVKWLTRIQVLERQHDGFFVQTAYRYPKRPVSPGSSVDAADTEPLGALPVKSIITFPVDGGQVPAGRVRISGFAWAGEQTVARVDVSVDGGRTWRAATLGGESAPYAWRQFEYHWQASQRGPHEIMSRATDSAGRRQPSVAAWNPSGYLWNSVDRVRIGVAAERSPEAPGRSPRASLPDDPLTPVVEAKCRVCHDVDLITQQRLSSAGWSREVDKMIRWGADVSDRDRGRMIEFFARHFTP